MPAKTTGTGHGKPAAPRRSWWAGLKHRVGLFGLAIKTLVSVWPYMLIHPMTYHHRINPKTLARFALPGHQIVFAMRSALYVQGQSKREDRIWALTPEYLVSLKRGPMSASSRFVPRERIIGLKSKLMKRQRLLDLTLYAHHATLRLVGVSPENLATLRGHLPMRRRAGKTGLQEETARRAREAREAVLQSQPHFKHVVPKGAAGDVLWVG